jgi:predicted metal-dependent TIM-barrel fold hydrolase
MTTAEVVLDHFHRLLNNDIKRASANGLKLFVALGVHPRSISQNYDMVIEHLPNLLQNDLMVAIGEIGLETTSKDEINVFSKQLELADDLKTKVIVHTPRTNKKEVTEATTEIILENINPKLVLIDHVDFEIVDNLIDYDFTLGLTVQPLKMRPYDAVKLLKKYGTGKFVLNSDISSSPSDPISVPRTVHAMRMADFSGKDIKSVSEKNATNFFNLKI